MARVQEKGTPFFVFPPDIRRVIYTTNAIESLNMQLRNVLKKSVRGAFDWKSAMNQFAILYGDRCTLART